jgi:hydrogenase expression/formation protein HypE
LHHQPAGTTVNPASSVPGRDVVTGHTGFYEGVSKLIGVCTAYGAVAKNKLIMPGNAKPGDLILCTKSVGLELLINFSFMHKAMTRRLFGAQRADALLRLVESQSCVKEALELAKVGGVNAMHDATEGGLVAALNEVADASEVGFRVEMEKLPITRETWTLRDHFKLTLDEMLSMSSTGTMLAAVNPQAKGEVEETLRRTGVAASFVGNFTKNKNRVLTKNDGDVIFPQISCDPYSRILSQQM